MAFRLSIQAVAELENGFRSGLSESEAARRVRCSQTSAHNYYELFEGDCVPRGERRRAPNSIINPPLPIYSGPVTIGKAITPATKPQGPDWIGVTRDTRPRT